MDLDGNAANGRQDGMGMKQLCHEVRPLDPKKFAKTMDLYYIYTYIYVLVVVVVVAVAVAVDVAVAAASAAAVAVAVVVVVVF